MRIVFELTQANALRLVHALCQAHDYIHTAEPLETEAQFARRMLVKQMVSMIASVEGQAAGDAALLAAKQAAYDEVDITPTEEP